MPALNELTALRDYFESGITRPYNFRKEQLVKFKKAIQAYESRIFDALFEDLRKNKEEAWVTENGFVISEISYALNNLERWMKRESVRTNLLNFPSKSFIYPEPKGVVLIIGPWNYPFQLLLAPVAGAIAAGNCIVIKPSEFAPATSAVIKDLISETFDRRHILFAEGEGSVVVPQMMKDFTFDHVFFTGSTAVGRKIYQAAAEKLIPVTLELGGKSPCIVEADADIKVAARRIVMPKFSNAGQMCVAPDYILVHESIREKLTDEIRQTIQKFYGDDPASDMYYGKIINEKQFDRLDQLLRQSNIIFGGIRDRNKLFISPTLIKSDVNDPVMTEEIFGPVLPILTYRDRKEALRVVSKHKDPLALYVFTSTKETEKFWIENVPFGGGCINNAGWHLTNHHLPFGGRGNSGIGYYHGRFSFDTFSHKKAIMKTPAWFDPSVKYPPLNGRLPLFKRIFGR